MNYYKIAPLRLNLPPLIYKSNLALQKNSIVKICVKNKNALGIVLDSAKKPNFECLEAVESEFYLTQNQAVLGRFIASYYCVNEGVAFGIMTLGNSSLGLHSADFANLGRFADFSPVSHPKFAKNHESQTENPSVVDSARNAQNLSENQSKFAESIFHCHSERSEESQENNIVILSVAKNLKNNQNRDSSVASLSQNDNFKKNAESTLDSADSQNLAVKNNPCEAPENSPASWCKKSGEASSSGKADFLLEAEKRGSPPKSEKRQLLGTHFKKVGGSGAGGAALLREESSEISGEGCAESIRDFLPTAQNDKIMDCNADSANLLAMTENQSKIAESIFHCHSERSEESQKNNIVILSEAKNLKNNQSRDSSVASLPQNDNIKKIAESTLDSANPAPFTHEANSAIADEFLGLCEASDKDKTKVYRGSEPKHSLKSRCESKFALDSAILQNLPKLSHLQQNALNFILSHDKTLLFGDTGSGKTEIYANAIYETLSQGKNTLFLMPEIALTPQMERRLKHIFGEFVCIWHSKISKAKKEQILANLDSALDSANPAPSTHEANSAIADEFLGLCEASDKDKTKVYRGSEPKHSLKSRCESKFALDFAKIPIKIIVGARSALFLPLSNIGLIIVDEEHDEAYKSTTTPRYNARDLAIFLAQKQGIRLILGSATPSVNSYYNFGRESAIFRLRGGYFQGKKSVSFDSEILSPNLLEKIRIVLENRKQIIVFVPLRGNFKVLQCVSCGCGIKCENCAVNMSLHSKRNALICHYCGFAKPFFNGRTKCQNCPSVEFSALKIGTQEICKQLQSHFSRAKIAIFDRDEVKSDSKMRKILGEFNDCKIDILVGTQMISKGHDYHNVALVAILGIDGVLNSSDFRAYERALSLLTQISGRTARKNDGEVVINTRNREFFTPFLNDYEAFLRFELENRKNLYPPFRRLALLIAQSKDESKAQGILQNAKKIVESAQKKVEIVGLNKAPIERINGLWRYFLLLRSASAKELLSAISLCKNLPLIIDIDPQQVF